jgi:hypothetical protein
MRAEEGKKGVNAVKNTGKGPFLPFGGDGDSLSSLSANSSVSGRNVCVIKNTMGAKNKT